MHWLWTQEDIWYVSWGETPCWPFPLIYDTDGINASQWQYMSLFANNEHGAQMLIQGPVTQSKACQQFPDNCGYNLDNTPHMAFNQLSTELNSNPLTAQGDLRWATDMKWHNPNP
jgi:hypothetical protein